MDLLIVQVWAGAGANLIHDRSSAAIKIHPDIRSIGVG